MALAAMKLALASLEAEPLCVIDQANLDYLNAGFDADVWPASRTEMGDVLLIRAAMLQGAEPVSNRDELPDGWVACSERMPDEYDYDIWIYSPGKGVCHGVAYAGGGEFMDDECQFKIDDATHWMPMVMPAAPQQEVK